MSSPLGQGHPVVRRTQNIPIRLCGNECFSDSASLRLLPSRVRARQWPPNLWLALRNSTSCPFMPSARSSCAPASSDSCSRSRRRTEVRSQSATSGTGVRVVITQSPVLKKASSRRSAWREVTYASFSRTRRILERLQAIENQQGSTDARLISPVFRPSPKTFRSVDLDLQTNGEQCQETHRRTKSSTAAPLAHCCPASRKTSRKPAPQKDNVERPFVATNG